MILYRLNDDGNTAVDYAQLGSGTPDDLMVQATRDGTISENGQYILPDEGVLLFYTVINTEDDFWAIKGAHRIWLTEYGSVAAGFPEVLSAKR